MNIQLLRELNQRTIIYYPIYAKATKSTEGGILLSQLMYWFSEQNKICKTNKDMEEETSLTTHQMKKAKKQIKLLSFITITKEGIPSKTFYKIDWTEYEKVMSDLCDQISRRES